MVWGTRRIEFPVDTFLDQRLSNCLLIPVKNVLKQFFFGATKLVPLSDQITQGMPRRETNLSIPMTQLLVSIDGKTSKWTARVVRQVKKNPHRFFVERLIET